jgi:CheY-like chemotaxis protein
MLTSAGQRGDAARCRRLDVAAYLAKPVSREDLHDALRVTLGRGAAGGRRELVTRYYLEEARCSLRILLAEDNRANQIVAAQLLKKRGHRVTVVENGRLAVEALRDGAYDLVLMDVQMPELDGYEATRLIRRAEVGSARHVPILALTAHAMKGDREKCLEAGMDDYISKPIRPEVLFEAIEGVCAQGQLGRASRRKPPSALQARGVTATAMDLERALETVGGDRRLLRELAGIFLDEHPRLRERLRTSARRKDAGTLASVAHAVKGSMGNFGARAAVEAVTRVEDSARRGNLGEAEAALDELERHLADLCRELESLTEPQQGDGESPSGGADDAGA